MDIASDKQVKSHTRKVGHDYERKNGSTKQYHKDKLLKQK